MLHALLCDLDRLADRRVIATLDDRLPQRLPPGVEVVPVAPGAHRDTFRELAAGSDDVWIIAPETRGRLAALAELAEGLRARPVGSGPEAVRAASDKLALSRRLEEAGLRTPRTWPAEEAGVAAREIGFPLVLKPAVGAGCEGVGLAGDGAELEAALRRAEAVGDNAIVQEYVQGTPASASILCAKGRAVPLSLNGQETRVAREFLYNGGWVPLRHPFGDRALAAACGACELVPGLAGYVGVDLVLAPSGPVVIEINPRLTTSYVGLRAATDVNLADIILDAVEQGRLPEAPSLQRTAWFDASGSVETSPV